MDLISVIVPVYNVEKYLMRCVDSIRRQTYENIEIILVDDGSPDRCPDLCEEIKLLDSRVKVVHKENGGLGFARNSGLDVATGTYVTFIDSDDWISDNHIESLYCAAKRMDADAVIGSHTTAAADGSLKSHPIKLKEKVYEGTAIREEIVLPLVGADVTYPDDVQLSSSSCMNLYRMDVILRNAIRFLSEKEAVAEDMYFNIDYFCNAKRVVAVNEVGYYYYENLESISRKYNKKRFERTLRFYEIMKRQMLQYGLQNQVSFRVERTFLMKIRVALRLIVLSELSWKEKHHEIKQILDHNLVKKVLEAYPVDTYISAMRILTGCMCRGNATLVYGMIKVREYARKTMWLKVFLKRIGIGK